MELLRLDELRVAARVPPEPANFIGRLRMQNLAADGGTC